MQYRQLGRSGVRVSVIGLGTNRFGYERLPQEEVNRVIAAAVDLEINFIDTADLYQGGRSEETLGQALKGKRNRFVLATKFSGKVGEGQNDWGGSRYHMVEAVESSLRRLQTDHIDLYYVHFYDETTPIEETMRALDDLVQAGKVLYVASSNFMAWQIERANSLAEFHGWSPFVATQAQYHLLERDPERELLSFCRSRGVGLIAYLPLAGGFLTGKYRRGQAAPPGSRGETSQYVQQYMTDVHYTLIEKLSEWARQRGHTLAETAHAWLLAHPEVSSVLSGATRLEQVQQNAKAGDWMLTQGEVDEIEKILKGSEKE